jgi:hypothetical protein
MGRVRPFRLAVSQQQRLALMYLARQQPSKAPPGWFVSVGSQVSGEAGSSVVIFPFAAGGERYTGWMSDGTRLLDAAASDP